MFLGFFQVFWRNSPLISPNRREIIYCKRAILSLSSSKILTPRPPLRLASVSSPPPPTNAGVRTRRAERGMGGQYFGRRERQDCPLTVNDLSTLLTICVNLLGGVYFRLYKQTVQCDIFVQGWWLYLYICVVKLCRRKFLNITIWLYFNVQDFFPKELKKN